MACNILQIFTKDDLASFKTDLEGNLHGNCPSCGRSSSGSNSSGFTIFIKTNTCYCHNSKTSFDVLETIALIKGIISCKEGRQSK